MVWHWLHVFWSIMHFAIIGKIFKSGWFWRKLIWKYSPLKSYLYYNQRISLFNDLINMNIQINIETLLFGNDTNTDQTNSFFLIRFSLLNRQKELAALDCCFFFLISLFFPVCSWLFRLLLIPNAMLYYFAVAIYNMYCTRMDLI